MWLRKGRHAKQQGSREETDQEVQPAVGDVWRATSVDGFVYFQVAGDDVLRPFPAAFVRTLPGVYKAALGKEEIIILASREQFIIRFPFEHFVNLPRFSFEGTFELPEAMFTLRRRGQR